MLSNVSSSSRGNTSDTSIKLIVRCIVIRCLSASFFLICYAVPNEMNGLLLILGGLLFISLGNVISVFVLVGLITIIGKDMQMISLLSVVMRFPLTEVYNSVFKS